jgi:hypothetical protein
LSDSEPEKNVEAAIDRNATSIAHHARPRRVRSTVDASPRLERMKNAQPRQPHGPGDCQATGRLGAESRPSPHCACSVGRPVQREIMRQLLASVADCRDPTVPSRPPLTQQCWRWRQAAPLTGGLFQRPD